MSSHHHNTRMEVLLSPTLQRREMWLQEGEPTVRPSGAGSRSRDSSQPLLPTVPVGAWGDPRPPSRGWSLSQLSWRLYFSSRKCIFEV